MKKEWLVKKVELVQVEESNMVDISGRKPLACFGHINKSWEKFKKEIHEGDEIWEFRTAEESWAALAGAEGYALVRNGEVVSHITTSIN